MKSTKSKILSANCTILISFSLFVSHICLAVPGFYTLKTLPEQYRPLDLVNSLDSTFQVQDTRGDCSGFFISNTGYWITAAHCTHGCLSAKRKNGEALPVYVPQPEFQKKECSLKAAKLNRTFSTSSEFITSGKGFTGIGSMHLEDASEDELEFYEAHFGDYVILKMNLPKPVHCIPLSRMVPAIGDEQFSLGYPGKTKRNGAYPDSPGDHLRISYGKISNSFAGNQVLDEFPKGDPYLTIFKRIYLRDDILISDSDFYNGLSGGPAVNQAGKLIGINIETNAEMITAESSYTKNSAMVLSVQRIQQQLGEEKLNEIFDCQVN